jgi:hypothetical protein
MSTTSGYTSSTPTGRMLSLPSNATTKYSPRDLPAAEKLERRRIQDRLSQRAFRQRKRVKGDDASDIIEDKELETGLSLPELAETSTGDTFTIPHNGNGNNNNNGNGSSNKLGQATDKRKDRPGTILSQKKQAAATLSAHASRMAPILPQMLESAVVMDRPVDRLGRLSRLVGHHQQQIQKVGKGGLGESSSHSLTMASLQDQGIRVCIPWWIRYAVARSRQASPIPPDLLFRKLLINVPPKTTASIVILVSV